MPRKTTLAPTARAVVVGLTNVDPRRNNGWRGDCPGCDVDAAAFASLGGRNGVATLSLANAGATKARVIKACRAACKGMAPGSLFILYISGHGGQVRDTHGDEADGMDETICLWDGQLVDDELMVLWMQVPPGVRVLFITDTCNSGTNFRAVPIKVAPSIPPTYSGQLIHMGGCPDGLASVGGPKGGVFTSALMAAWNPGQTYRQWCARAARVMPRSQRPVYAEFGEVSYAFKNGPAFGRGQ